MLYRYFLTLTLLFALVAGFSAPLLAQETSHGAAGHEATAAAGHAGEEHHTFPLKAAGAA